MKRKIRRHRAAALKQSPISLHQFFWGIGTALIVTYFVVLRSVAWAEAPVSETHRVILNRQCIHAHGIHGTSNVIRKPASHSLGLLAAIHPFGTVNPSLLDDPNEIAYEKSLEGRSHRQSSLLTQDANFSGEYLSLTFEKSPIYAPPVFDVYRFPTP